MTATVTNPLELGQEPLDVKKPDDDDLRLWSVTTILGVLDKPALLYWAAEQTAKAAIAQQATWRSMAEESGTDEAVKWLRDARFRRAKDSLSDAEFGTQLHGLLEEYALKGVRPDITEEVFKADVDAARKCVEQFDRWLQEFQPAYQATEVTVYSPTYGIAGTCDGFLTIDGVRLIIDYKSSKKSFDAQGKPTGLYPEVALQLAAYRHAEMAAVWRPRRFEHFRRRYYALSTNEQGMAVPVPEVDGGLGIKVTPEHCTAYPVQCGPDVYEAFLFCLEVARFQFEKAKGVIGDALVAPAGRAEHADR